MQVSDNGNLQSDEEALLEAIEQYIIQTYKPVDDPQKAELHLSTSEMYRKLLKLYPNELAFRPEMLAGWLKKAGFQFYEYGDMNFEWMMDKR